MSKKINILHITTMLSSHDGISETLRILSKGLNRGRFNLGLCSIQDHTDEILPELQEFGTKIFGLQRKGYFFDFLTTIRLIKVIKEFSADIVHTHLNKAHLHGRLAACLSPNVSIVSTHHDMIDIAFSETPSLQKRHRSRESDVHECSHPDWLTSVFYPFVNVKFSRLNAKVIGVSDIVTKIYTSDPDDDRFETVYAPYDEAVFQPNYNGFTSDKVVLGTVGRLVKPKGHRYLLDAFKRLRQDRDNLFLRIIGDGPLRPELEIFINEIGLAPYVTLCGALPHESTLYENIDIYVQPSISEGCSITLLEAMGVGIPVVASDIEGPKELIIADKTGILVPPKDPEALYKAILSLIENRELAVQLGQAGNKRALDNFSSKKFIEKMTRIYEEVTGDSQRSGIRCQRPAN